MGKEKSSPTSEVDETGEKEVSTPTSEVDKITLDEHLKQDKVHTGLVASFRVEIANDEALGLPKNAEDWKLALEAQSNKLYA
jgi:hypothetical protein